MAGARLSVGASKGGVKRVPTPPSREFVLGSRPPGLRAPPIQRIKPAAASTTQYGKISEPTTAGDTGQTPWS